MHDLLGSLPENVSTYGADIDSLYRLILYITAGAFILVQGTLVYFLWRYRAGASTRAVYTHGNARLEIAWSAVPALILVFLGFMSRGTWVTIKMNMPQPDVTVMVTGKQFNWEIEYAGPDGKFKTEDDYTVDNDLKVPVNKVVRVLLGSNDVIHSFFVPQARLKQDALPGREIPAWFQITKPGVYEIPCAELCGFGHSGMKGQLSVLSDADYAAWVQQQWPPPGQAPAQGGEPAAPAGESAVPGGETGPAPAGGDANPATSSTAPAEGAATPGHVATRPGEIPKPAGGGAAPAVTPGAASAAAETSGPARTLKSPNRSMDDLRKHLPAPAARPGAGRRPGRTPIHG